MTDNNRNIATVDKRPFFEKALSYGVLNDIIDHAKRQAIIGDGAKGSVQIADFFGSSHLYTDLDNARKRMINLISLFLEDAYASDLEKAAISLRDNTFLSHSRGGNDMLKALHALPDCAVFGDVKSQDLKSFQDERTLIKPYTLSAYRKERQTREEDANTLAAATWFAKSMALPRSALEFTSAETVIRSAILVRAAGADSFPNRHAFATLLSTIRAQATAVGKLKIAKKLLDDVPEEYLKISDKIRKEIEKHDAPLIANNTIALDELRNTIELRYFVRESGMDDVEEFDTLMSEEWRRVTGGKEDPFSRLTAFLCIAADIKPKTTISEAEAKAITRQVRQHGFNTDAVAEFITTAAPFEMKENLLSLWEDEFLPEATSYLLDQDDIKYLSAIKFLKENCNIKLKTANVGKKKAA
ncbi:hypothetical protein QN360_00690 [Glaciimonas sp. CA11.2]|uniref:hypothetical protein n=1 Tax=unclassified Glaciimonas TaxID=2644401 RepID=UPI002AB579AC|nr:MULTISPECIES: hypothetical protein [unclassified Glaciimonas]MDY7545915.1 hypothetical protein [Glaciimonas sp. CA11.2]MEB0012241.1 hypothetical protein [Glaciimonas sp. Cout2]MEB0082424.1 hypothetical protein [Glaciimonas sp. Gout2]MEB0161426.1 hypothetical protein [Glaciimonas sp. CA11.2]